MPLRCCTNLSNMGLTMLKQALIYLVLTVLVVVFSRLALLCIVYVDYFYSIINLKLAPLFSYTGIGLVLRKIILFTLIPAAIASIPALTFRLVRGKDMPYLVELTWFFWIILVLSNMLIR